jgi:hypothetical protein
VKFPADWIVQRMRTRIAPMPIETEIQIRAARAAKLEELTGDQQRGFGRYDARFRNCDQCFLTRLFVWRTPGFL